METCIDYYCTEPSCVTSDSRTICEVVAGLDAAYAAYGSGLECVTDLDCGTEKCGVISTGVEGFEVAIPGKYCFATLSCNSNASVAGLSTSITCASVEPEPEIGATGTGTACVTDADCTAVVGEVCGKFQPVLVASHSALARNALPPPCAVPRSPSRASPPALNAVQLPNTELPWAQQSMPST